MINGLCINGNVQTNEKNLINSPNFSGNLNDYFNTPMPRISKQIHQQNFIQLNKTNKNTKNKINGIIPLGNLLKQIGEAISQNQTNQNITSLISKIPNPNTNSNSKVTSYKFIKK